MSRGSCSFQNRIWVRVRLPAAIEEARQFRTWEVGDLGTFLALWRLSFLPERTLAAALGLRTRRVGGRLWYLFPGDGRRRGLEHDNALLKTVLALRNQGLPPFGFMVEPRLFYRSPAAGPSHLGPDIYLCGGGGWFIEVDRGTERRRQLRHKLLRYREWFWVKGGPARLAVLCTPDRVAGMKAALAEVQLSAEVASDPGALALCIRRRSVDEGR